MLHSIIVRTTCALFLYILALGAAFAENVALVVGNRNYENADWMHGAEFALNSSRALQQNGFTTFSGRDLDGRQTRQALTSFSGRVQRADSVVVMLSGHFVHTAKDTWFLPVDGVTPSLATINFVGISLNNLFEIVGQKPGGAAVFLGTEKREISLGAGLKSGLGVINPPQGVFAAVGAPDASERALCEQFLVKRRSLADALKASRGFVRGYGFISNSSSLFGPFVDSSSFNEEAAHEDGYWQASIDLGTKESIAAYLRRYPGGRYRQDALEWIEDHKPLSPTQEAQATEKALNLSVDERRKIQENLSLLGYNTRGIDGIFGRGTRAAIAGWQKDNDIPQTAFLTDQNIRKLRRQADRRATQLAEEARKKQAELEAEDTAYWASSGAARGREKALRRYLRRYPDGLFSNEARVRLEAIKEERRRNADVLERQTWDAAESGNTIESYERYLHNYPDGVFADDANSRLEVLREEKKLQAVVDAAKAEEASLKLNQFARVLVEKRLSALGLRPGIEDGNFDDKTRQALRKFQRARSFLITGYLTRQTLVRMIAEAGQ